VLATWEGFIPSRSGGWRFVAANARREFISSVILAQAGTHE
jgi:hypothetical protein